MAKPPVKTITPADAAWAEDKLSDTLERIRVQLLQHLAAIQRALQEAQR